MTRRRACIFGEVLFDHFPDGSRVLGGAPFNVAWHLQAFGQAPWFVSRVGEDREGDQIRAAMQDWGMSDTGLQTDPERATGKVLVRFDDGEPAYEIVENCAYDAIDADQIDTALVRDCTLLYHGSLALRCADSRRALERLKAGGPGIVFVDVNLRPPWWQRDAVLQTLEGAHWVKLNHDELQLLDGISGSGREQAAVFRREHDLDGLILTHGARGAELYLRDGSVHSAAPRCGIDAVDTVGAGDAFTAVMILGLRCGWPYYTCLERAQAFASGIVGRRGATVSDASFYRAFAEQWQLTA